jgi:hypothetical protein
MGLLLAGLGGAGEQLAKAGASAQNYFERSALDDQLAEIQKLRDERMNEFTAGESSKNRTHAETLQQQGFEHAEKLQTAMQDFQSLEHGLDREQRAQLHEETMTQLREQFKNQGLAIQSDKEGNLGVADLRNNKFTLLKGADGNPVKGAKADGDSIKLIEAIGHSMKAFDPLDPNTKDVRDKLGNALLQVLSGKTQITPTPPPGGRPALDSFDKNPKPKKAPAAPEPEGSGLLNADAAPAEPSYAQFVKIRRGGAFIDASPRSPAAALNGKSFGSKEEAMAALSALPAYKQDEE